MTKQIKPNFKTLGPKFGKDMKLIASTINQFTSSDIKKIETEGEYKITLDIIIDLSDVELSSADIPGWQVITQDGLTVALDISLSETLFGCAGHIPQISSSSLKRNSFTISFPLTICSRCKQGLHNS